ncbi:MAG TPA: DUF3352 domain-containing protein [Solirubrobacteraceae bacterium]|nr:DUF3352 domain-containing protein [Solirubrobacteraceae bacterium]
MNAPAATKPPRAPLRPIALALLASLLLTGAIAGCGSSTPPGANADPATVVPAGAPLYLGAVVRPEGNLKTWSLADARTLTRAHEPFAGLVQTLRSPGGKPLDYGRDVKPWLGSRAGAFVASVTSSAGGELLTHTVSKLLETIIGSGPGLLGETGLRELLTSTGTQGAIVLDTTDASAAGAFLHARAAEAGAHPVSYRGLSYELAHDGAAMGLVGEFAVIGTEAALRGVIDTKLGGPALVHASSYATLASSAEPGALATAYLEAHSLIGDVASSNGSGTEGLTALVRGLVGPGGPAYISLLPGHDSLGLDVDTISPTGAPAAGLFADTGGPQAIGSLPGNSWLALGVGDLRTVLSGGAPELRILAALPTLLGSGSLNIQGIVKPLTSKAIEPKRDLLSWAGSGAVFASGSGLLNLEGGIVFSSRSPAGSRAAVALLARAYRAEGAQVSSTSIPGAEVASTVKVKEFPVALTIAAGNGKLVIGLGPASAQEALSPTSTFAGSTYYHEAAATLGQGIQPSAFVSFPTMLALLEGLGLGQGQGTLAQLTPLLHSLNTLNAGGAESLAGGVRRARVVLTLQPTG